MKSAHVCSFFFFWYLFLKAKSQAFSALADPWPMELSLSPMKSTSHPKPWNPVEFNVAGGDISSMIPANEATNPLGRKDEKLCPLPHWGTVTKEKLMMSHETGLLWILACVCQGTFVAQVPPGVSQEACVLCRWWPRS